MTASAMKGSISPVLRFQQMTPLHASPSSTRSKSTRSSYRGMLSLTDRSQSVWSMYSPVLSVAKQVLGLPPPPNGLWAILPSSVLEKGQPQCSISMMHGPASFVMNATHSWSARKSLPLTVSNACFSHVSSFAAGVLAREAFTPPWAAPECDLTGCTCEMMAVSIFGADSTAALSPAKPPPITSILWYCTCSSSCYELEEDENAPDQGGDAHGPQGHIYELLPLREHVEIEHHGPQSVETVEQHHREHAVVHDDVYQLVEPHADLVERSHRVLDRLGAQLHEVRDIQVYAQEDNQQHRGQSLEEPGPCPRDLRSGDLMF